MYRIFGESGEAYYVLYSIDLIFNSMERRKAERDRTTKGASVRGPPFPISLCPLYGGPWAKD